MFKINPKPATFVDTHELSSYRLDIFINSYTKFFFRAWVSMEISVVRGCNSGVIDSPLTDCILNSAVRLVKYNFRV